MIAIAPRILSVHRTSVRSILNMAKFKARQRKQKHKQRQGQSTGVPPDTNAIEILSISKGEREERKRKLREELQEQQPNVSAKKQKRLDKYIENKLKKEENLELLKKLAQAKIDTSALWSAKDLGKRDQIHRERLPSANRADVKTNEIESYPIFSSANSNDSDSDSSSHPNAVACEVSVQTGTTLLPPIGIGLKQPLKTGDNGLPILKKRKKARRSEFIQEPPWEGFNSEDENDVDEAIKNRVSSGSEHGDDINDAPDHDDTFHPEHNSLEDQGSELGVVQPEPRNSAFKAWAIQQINEAVGFKPTIGQQASSKPILPTTKMPKRIILEDEPLPSELQTTEGNPNRQAFSVQVDRSERVQKGRLGLPIVAEEQKIMEAIHNNPSVVVWGATGSGKTTQLPQFLFEAGYGNAKSSNPGVIGITQPRRVAAVSMAKRVADELGQFSDHVSYQIRFDTTVSNKTAIKFMTDGILLREISKDFSLSKYSIIIIDEAHERSVNTDILIGMVSRIVDLRKSMNQEDPSIKPLKLVIMSATLQISHFTQNTHLFRHGPPPLVQVEGRQYPVTIHFSRRTHRDFVEEAYRKVSRGHRQLPPGGMLVFLTGQNEIKHLSKRLKQAFKPTERDASAHIKVHLSAVEAPLEAEDLELGEIISHADDTYDSNLEILDLDDGEDDRDFDLGEESMDSSTRVHVLSLYSQLPTKDQLKVFEPPPEGSRLIVLATNVAETSLTIPGIKYVFDCGRSKGKQYNLFTGVQNFQVGWISKASANQRAGRAGRTGPGHCYRLYSSAVYESEFVDYTEPEILRTPIEGVVLQMKSMGLHNVTNFPFPTPPSSQGIAKAETLLKHLGALSSKGQVTEIGHRLSTYPLSPRFGKMLHIGHQHSCISYVIALVSALAVGDLFVTENQIDIAVLRDVGSKDKVYTNADRLEDTAREKRWKDYNRAHRLLSKHDDTSDALKYLSAVCAYAYASDGDSFCDQMFLREKALKEATQLRRQLTDLVYANNPGGIGTFEARLPEPSDKQLKALKQIITTGFIDNIAIRADLSPVPPDPQRHPKRAIDIPYLTLFRSREGRARGLNEEAVYVHPASILSHLSPTEMPQYVVYSHLQESASASLFADTVPRIRMFPLVAPSGLQLSALAQGTPLIEYSKPVGKIELLGGVPERRKCWVVPSLAGEVGSMGWPLPARNVIQKKDLKEGWIIERFLT